MASRYKVVEYTKHITSLLGRTKRLIRDATRSSEPEVRCVFLVSAVFHSRSSFIMQREPP